MLGDAACRLDCLLRAAGFGVIGGTSLFRLAAHDDAASWFERLGAAEYWRGAFRTSKMVAIWAAARAA